MGPLTEEGKTLLFPAFLRPSPLSKDRRGYDRGGKGICYQGVFEFHLWKSGMVAG